MRFQYIDQEPYLEGTSLAAQFEQFREVIIDG
jgi:hypothetical protein